ncbi:MAG: YraN family protein [Proteobacteria bacterium]|nr:YraN family protein [Pseudomonadota bacterium]
MGRIFKWRTGANKKLDISEGDYWEKKAESFLLGKGLKLINRNYRTKVGEIDLIMMDKEFLVFVEVRYRMSEQWANPAESVTRAKQLKIIKTAQHYLLCKNKTNKLNCRFDVVAINGTKQSPAINWIEHAFM